MTFHEEPAPELKQTAAEKFAEKSQTFKNQFLMSKADSVARKLHSSNDCIAKGNTVSTDFMTSNNFYHQMTANSQ